MTAKESTPTGMIINSTDERKAVQLPVSNESML